ncbi:Arb2 domain [Penicillium camemberti]|uniref:Arb2 domain n=1 Tax=Penicillium camemberti (strain FM 013) TaxID=1429867 RepID=A0A0G4NUL5_PENC3|nr:Arb2 domain [Penicillium camemberti]
MNGVPGDFLPDDSVSPEDLRALGFVITKDDKIRYIAAPDQGPRYKVNRSDRMNKVHIEALHKVIRTCIIDRLVGMGMDFMGIPEGSKQQVPIMVSGNVNTAPRVVVFFGEIIEDLGVFSYRDACDDGISFGSILGFAKGLLGVNAQYSPNALVLANIGQNVWSNSGWSPMTADSARSQRRNSVVERKRPLDDRNVIGKGSVSEHVENIFHQVLMRGNYFQVGARIDVIGMSEGGHAAMTYLKNQWSFWSPHISSLSLINPEAIATTKNKTDDVKDPASFAWFMKHRSRGWTLSRKPLGTRVPGLEHIHGCNTYSSGENTKSTCMVSRGVGHILTWMNIMHYSPMATEKFDVVPGESDLSSEAADALLLSDILLEVPGGKIEVHSLEVMNQIKSFLTGVTFTKEMVTFFNAKFSFDSDGDSDGDSECTAVYVGENHDAFDALPDVPDASPGGSECTAVYVGENHDAFDALPDVPDTAPGTSRDGLPVPDVLPGASSEASRGIIPNVLPDDPGVPPVGLGVFGMPGALPDVLADALSVPETQTHYDDVIVGQTGPFNLSDLQDIREDEQED